jgi:hypothetical protein
MDKTIDMARETKMPYDFVTGEPIYLEKLKAFEALVRADEREIVMNEPLTKAQWQRFEDEIRADEREKAKHNEEVLMNALWKACGDDGQMVVETIESQGELK